MEIFRDEMKVENGDISIHFPMGQKRQNEAHGFTAGIRSENSLFDILQIVTLSRTRNGKHSKSVSNDANCLRDRGLESITWRMDKIGEM